VAALVVLEVVVVALFIAEPWDRNGVGRIESIGWVRVEIAPDEQTAVVWSFPVSNECWEYHDTTVEPMGDEVVIDVTNRQVSPNGTPCTLACSVGVDPHEVPWDPEVDPAAIGHAADTGAVRTERRVDRRPDGRRRTAGARQRVVTRSDRRCPT
jgi:hypothetical protein